jgi:hypothetical protein
VHQRARDDQLLPHSVAVRFGQLIFPPGQLEQLEQLVNAALHNRSLLAVEGRRKAEELRSCELIVDERTVRDETEASLGLERPAVDVDASDFHSPAGGAQNSGDHPKGGGLPGAVRA